MRERIRRLQPAVEVARNHESDAAARYVQSKSRLEAERRKLDQLRAFRFDYMQRFQQDGQAGLSARRAQDYTAFICNLDANLEQLHGQVSLLAAQVEQARKAWAATRARTRALDGVIDGYRREHEQVLARREQAETDEFALRRLMRNGDEG